MKKEQLVKKKTTRRKIVKRNNVVKKESKFVQVYLFIKKKLADIVTMFVLLLPAAAEFLNVHKELIRTEYGTLYYIIIGILYTYYTNKKKQEEGDKEDATREDKDDSSEDSATESNSSENASESVTDGKDK